MRAVIYTRVSLDAKAEGRSVTEQEAECRAWAEREDWTVELVIDETGSASRYASKARTGWDEATAALATGRYEILLTWEHSRATRRLGDYSDLRDLCAKHGVLWGYSGKVYDLTDREDRFRTGLDALMSEDESHKTSERVTRSVRARAAAGTPHGRIPYGYRREYDPHTGALLRQVPDETTAPIVRNIFERIAAGDTLYAVARDLTAASTPMPRPSRDGRRDTLWTATTLKDIILSPTYVARRVHRGEVVGDAAWAPLVSTELQARAQAVLASRPTVRRRDTTARWLLSGIARCGRDGCAGPMRHADNHGVHSYRCAGRCKRTTRKLQPVDDHVTALTLALLRHAPSPDDETIGDELRDALDQVDALERRLEGFTQQGINGTLSPATLAKIEAGLAPQIMAAKAKARRLAAPAALARWDLSDVDALWASLDVADKRALLRDAVTVTILPGGVGRSFDPDLVIVTPTW